MAAHCADTGHDFNLVEAKFLTHASSWTARPFKEAWLSNENSINKCIELPQFCERKSADDQYNRLTINTTN